MKSVQDRAAEARAAHPPHTHRPVINPNKLAHEATGRILATRAAEQNWGPKVATHTEANGKQWHRHESATHVTEVVHHGTETVVYRHQFHGAPANVHAVTKKHIMGMAGRWGRYAGHVSLPNGIDIHTFNDATHRTGVMHRGAEILTHRKPH